ncbi:phage tail assembly protein [Burkholderia ambifaria]|uniref:phage tail assembly protein n=1 Tax=Burkholderia ambifaria TaxID=152480 RepID=UPI001FC7FB7E|nr:phage tail assembly protein [Burkholderia ambifaria]
MRGAQKLAPNDAEEQELILFASLAEVAPTDLDAMNIRPRGARRSARVGRRWKRRSYLPALTSSASIPPRRSSSRQRRSSSIRRSSVLRRVKRTPSRRAPTPARRRRTALRGLPGALPVA